MLNPVSGICRPRISGTPLTVAWKWVGSTSNPQQPPSEKRNPDFSLATFKNGQRNELPRVHVGRRFRWDHQGAGAGSSVEVPIPSVLVVILSGIIWYLTRNHKTMENEITFRTFLNDLLGDGLVERVEVVNREFVRVVLKRGIPATLVIDRDLANQKRSRAHIPPSPEPSKLDQVVWDLADTSFGQQVARLLFPHRSLDNEFVCFQVGDCSKLEHLITSASQGRALPPIVYRDEVDFIALTRNYIPSIVLTALAFSTFTQHNPSSVASGWTSSVSQPSPPHDRILKFGKAYPILGKDVPKVTFNDVAGLEQAKKEVSEFVEFLKRPTKFLDLGAELPKGALLVGPPGTGKTLLAKAVAGEANVPFYSMSGSDFIELFVGVGPSRVRDLFDRARKNAPAIVFIDEIDTIGRSRAPANAPGTGGSDERESTLNALLVEMDGFTTKSGVVILGGTNRGDVLDPALTRPGRFDRQIALGKPSVRERKAIFDIHLRPIKVDERDDRSEIARRLAALTPGFTGAEIRSVCNEAAILAARKDAKHVTLDHLEQSVERLVGGLQKTGEILTPAMRKHVALHEAGHAVAGWFLHHADPVLKISIVPRASGSLGYTQLLPDDLLLTPREELLSKLCVLLGGRASEYLFAGSVTTGASDDLAKATHLAYCFVSQLGLDEAMGLVSYPFNNSQFCHYSESTATKIDSRVDLLIKQQWERCITLLKKREHEVRLVADLLLERETISFADLKEVLGEPPGHMKESLRQFVEALPRRRDGAVPPIS